jgi:uncharacterized membrane protein
MMTWTVAAPAISAAFLSSLVEAVEALTIVLALGIVRGWRPAGLGALVGLVLLALIVLALGSLLDRVPLHILQLTIGVLLLLFGMRWLRKAILRAAGVIPLHDETIAYAAETAQLREQERHYKARLLINRLRRQRTTDHKVFGRDGTWMQCPARPHEATTACRYFPVRLTRLRG